MLKDECHFVVGRGIAVNSIYVYSLIFSSIQASIRVLVTGAAGQIAYSLLYPLAKGDVFGVDQVRYIPRWCFMHNSSLIWSNHKNERNSNNIYSFRAQYE